MSKIAKNFKILSNKLKMSATFCARKRQNDFDEPHPGLVSEYFSALKALVPEELFMSSLKGQSFSI